MSRLNLDDFPDSPCAHELRRGAAHGPFAPELEAAYLQRHLQRMHLRVRIWFLLGFGLEVFFGVDQILGTGVLSWGALVHLLLLGPARFTLMVLAWTPLYRRFFLPGARLLVPLIHIPIAVLVADALSHGRAQQLATLVLLLVGIFSFCGLLFNAAARTGAAMVVAFTLAALAFGLPQQALISAVVVLAIAASIAAVVYKDVELSDRKSFLEGALIEELVARDGLTGLRNRRAFDEHLPQIWKHALREKRTIALLMVDIDHFKRYNDTHGHQAGDAALRAVAQALKSFTRRPLDIAARYGGEEFAIILYDLPSPYPQYIAEHIRSAVQALGIASGIPESPFVTVSIGVALVQPKLDRTPHGALQFADEALYKAKLEGRNRAVVRHQEEYDASATGKFHTAA